MKQATPRRRGRPPKGELTDKASTLTTRIQVETREALEVLAKRNRRSLSQQAELCLREGLGLTTHFMKKEQIEKALGGPANFGMALLVAKVVQGVEMITRKSWQDDPYTFEQTCKAIAIIWNAVRPTGESVPAEGLPQVMEPEHLGQSVAMGALMGLQMADPAPPLPKKKVHYSDEKIYSTIKTKLQDVVGRLT